MIQIIGWGLEQILPIQLQLSKGELLVQLVHGLQHWKEVYPNFCLRILQAIADLLLLNMVQLYTLQILTEVVDILHIVV